MTTVQPSSTSPHGRQRSTSPGPFIVAPPAYRGDTVGLKRVGERKTLLVRNTVSRSPQESKLKIR